MSCTVQKPDPKTLFDDLSTRFSTTVLGGAPIIPESNEYYVVGLETALHQEFYAVAEQFSRESDPRHMCCENLTKYGSDLGIYPRPANFSQGYVRVNGTPGTIVPATLRFQFGNAVFESASATLATVPDIGYVVVRVAAIEPGLAGNISATVGNLITPVPDLDSSVTLYGGRFCGGSEAEDCEAFRARVLERQKYQPRFVADWLKKKAMEWPCVTDACDVGPECCITDQFGNPDCPTRIEFYVLFRGTFDCGLPPQCVIDEINDWLFGDPQGYGLGQAEFGVCGGIRLAQAAKIDIVLDGMGCASPLQLQTIQTRITDFVARLCPSTTLTVEMMRLIATQVLGPEFSFDILFRRPDPETPAEGFTLSHCGDAVPACDYKICLNRIIVANQLVSPGGC